MGEEEGTGEPSTHRFLIAAEYFLRERNFADCRKYALLARDSEPADTSTSQILSIASVLSVPSISSTQYDHYAVFNLPRYESDDYRIRSSFEGLTSLLHPNGNPYPHASEALVVVLQAWSVLSDPVEKAKFDEVLRMSTGGCSSGSDGGTFWTMCPYCYYVYEYDKAFEECCLRCANGRCRRVLHAVAIGSPPPPDVVERGYFWCPGFMPLEIRKANGEEFAESLWVPFATSTGSSSKGCDHNWVACEGQGLVADTFDDERVVDGGNGKRRKTENGTNNCSADAYDYVKRQDLWDDNGRMFMGNGVREVKHGIDGNRDFPLCEVVEEGDSNAVDGKEWVDSDPGIADKTMGGIEFFEGDDDVLVGLECGFDMENGDL